MGVTLVGGACLLRFYMRWRRMSFDNPVGRFVQALSDWLVWRLQRVAPPAGGLDVASLLAAWLLKLVQYAALLALLELSRWRMLPVLALLGTARLAVSVATAVVIIAAVMSWVGNRTLAHDVFERLCAPLLAPIRRRIPAGRGGPVAAAAGGGAAGAGHGAQLAAIGRAGRARWRWSAEPCRAPARGPARDHAGLAVAIQPIAAGARQSGATARLGY